MGESIKTYKVYIKPFKIGPNEGLLALHGFGNKYHGNIAYIDAQFNRKNKPVFYISASNIGKNPEGFDIEKFSWDSIKEMFNEIPSRAIGTINYSKNSKEHLQKLDRLLKKEFGKHIGNEMDLEFIALKQ